MQDIRVFSEKIDEIGEREIKHLSNAIRKAFSNFNVLLLYFSLSQSQQDLAVFGASESQKCIVSANITETSLTVDDVIFVIDFGPVKQLMYMLAFKWTCYRQFQFQSRCKSKKVLCGPYTQPGVCYL
jgi:HrpA-like RNA helicase